MFPFSFLVFLLVFVHTLFSLLIDTFFFLFFFFLRRSDLRRCCPMSPATHPPLTFAFECTHSLLPHGCSPYVLCFLARTPPPSPFTWRGCVYMKLLVFARAPPCLDRPLFLFFLFFLFLLFPPFLPLSQQPFVVHPILFSLFSFLFPLSSFLYSSPFTSTSHSLFF